MSDQVVAPRGLEAATNITSDPYLYRIRELVYQLAGIFQDDNKLYFLEDRCRRRMQRLGIPSLRDYYDYLTTKPDRQSELHNLLNELTVSETCFFRHEPQLDALRRVVLPAIVTQRHKLAFTRLRVWSAGCSTGEEPYTLAMVLWEESMGLLKDWSFEVIATDVNDRSLAKAQAGLYSDYSLRNVNPYFLQKYFRPRGEKFQISEELKATVSFSRLNLLDESRMLFMKGVDVVFCCNVLIYFDGAAKRRVIQHFYNNLLPGGYLFLGYSESLFGVSDRFHLVHFPGATAYTKLAPQARQALDERKDAEVDFGPVAEN